MIWNEKERNILVKRYCLFIFIFTAKREKVGAYPSGFLAQVPIEITTERT